MTTTRKSSRANADTKVSDERAEQSEKLNKAIFSSMRPFASVRGDVGDAIVPLIATSIIVDRQAFSRRAESVLGDTINVEYLANALTDDDLRADIARFFTTRQAVIALVTDLLPAPMVNSDRQYVTAHELAERIERSRAFNGSSTVAVAIAEMLCEVVRPLGFVRMMEPWYSIASENAMIPKFEQLYKDQVKARIEEFIAETKLRVEDTNAKGYSNRVIAEMVANILFTFGTKLKRDVLDVRQVLVDVLKLVRAKIDPSFFEGRIVVDRSVLEHDALDQLAQNATLISFAFDPTIVGDEPLQYDTFELIRSIPKLATSLRSSKRYATVSLREFAERFTKTTLKTSEGRPHSVVLSFNARMSPVAMAIEMMPQMANLGVTSVMEYPRVSATMTNYYADLPKAISTERAHGFVVSTMASVVALHPEITRGVYDIGFLESIEQESVRRDDILNALALAKCASPYVAKVEGGFTFLYGVDLLGTGYMPSSSARVLNYSYVSDPAEYLLLVDDWTGTVIEQDTVQLLPKQVLERNIIGFDEVESYPLNRQIMCKFNMLDRQIAFDVKFLDLIEHKGLKRVSMVKPVLNSRVSGAYWDAVELVSSVATSVDSETVRVMLNNMILMELVEIVKSIPDGMHDYFFNKYRALIVNREGLTADERDALESVTKVNLIKSSLRIFTTAMILKRLGIVDQEVADTLLMRNQTNPDLLVKLTGGRL